MKKLKHREVKEAPNIIEEANSTVSIQIKQSIPKASAFWH